MTKCFIYTLPEWAANIVNKEKEHSVWYIFLKTVFRPKEKITDIKDRITNTHGVYALNSNAHLIINIPKIQKQYFYFNVVPFISNYFYVKCFK